MNKADIELHPEVRTAATVLKTLEGRGLVEPAIGSGWTRGWLTNAPASDIDVSYVGQIHYEQAQQILSQVLGELGVDPKPWDVKGIWNATIADGSQHTVDHYLKDYVSSIDTVYLAADGKLHDPTGFGFGDASTLTLRLNEYEPLKNGGTASQEAYICMEGCRRIAQLGWRPTEASALRMRGSAALWAILSPDEQEYFRRRLSKKYTPEKLYKARPVYEQFGWAAAFENPQN